MALGNDAECWQAFQDGMKQASHYPSIITVEHLGDGPATENTTRLRPTGPSPSFPWMPEVKPTGLDSLLNEAWRHGALVSALFEELGKDA